MAYPHLASQDYFSFVSHDPEVVQREQRHLELRRKEQTQYAIAQQLSAIDKDEYGEDILDDMFETEVRDAFEVAVALLTASE